MQFLVLSAFLGFNYWEYGVKAMQAQIWDDAHNDVNFPEVSLCHFQMEGKGKWVQCLLSMNMALELIFFIEWLWLVFLVAVTTYSLARWCFRICSIEEFIKFVKEYSCMINENQRSRKTDFPLFVTEYLGRTGVFLLRIIKGNTNDVVMSELMSKIWLRYCNLKSTTKYTKRQKSTGI